MPEDDERGTTPSRAARLGRRFLRRSWQALVVGFVVISVGVLAVISPGLVQADVRLDEGTVYIAKRDVGSLGVLNAQIDEIVAHTTVGDSAFNILQDEQLVLVHGTDSSTLLQYHPGLNRPDSPKQLPSNAKVQLGGGTLLVVTPDNGKAWFGDPESILAVDFQEQKAQLEVGDFGNATVTSAGDVIGINVQRSVLVRPGADGPTETLLPFALDPDVEKPDITAVGDKAVVFDRQSGRIWVEGMDTVFEVSGSDDAVLLPPVPGPVGKEIGARAVYATRAGLIALTDDGPRSLTGNLDAEAVDLVQVGSCLYSVFAEQFVLKCEGQEPEFQDIPGVEPGAKLVFQVNRSTVVLNDVESGIAWTVDDPMLRITWDNLTPPKEQANNQQIQTVTVVPPDRKKDNQKPIAENDQLGARAGRATILNVLDNDSDPDGDVLTITAPSEIPGATLQTVRGGSGLQITIDSETRGTLRFTYTIDDGRDGKDSAEVVVNVMSPDPSVDNGAPFKHSRAQPVVIGRDQPITKRVLMDWRDPDGDNLILVGASLPTDASDEVSFTPDGDVTFRDVGISTGTKKVTVTVSDGTLQEVGEMLVEVTDDVVAPIAYGDFATVGVGQLATVYPLANDVGQSLSLTEVIAQDPETCECQITTNHREQWFKFTSTKAGVHYVLYKISNGPVAMGLVRIDVSAETKNHPPVAALDVALLPPGGSVLIDPVLNDTDEDGDVLVIQSVSQHPALQVVLERRHLVTISEVHAPDEPITLTYQLSDGKNTVQGSIVVIPTPTTGSDTPQAAPDNVRIRAGTTQTVDVLVNDTSPVGLKLRLEGLVENPGDRAWIHGDRIRVAVPPGAQAGSFAVTYQLRDAEDRVASAKLQVTVVSEDAQNGPPEPRQVEERVLAGTTSRLIIPTDGIDPNGDAVRLVGLGSGPKLGRVLAVGDGWLSYEAYPDSQGTDVFSYQVMDSWGAEATGEIRVGVAPAGPDNLPPTGIADEIRVRPSRQVQIAALRNDVDMDGDTISYADSDPVEIDGIEDVEVIENREISFVAPDEEGTYIGTYWIQDSRSETGSGDLRIIVDEKAPLLPPEARDDVVSVSAVEGEDWVEVDVTANDFDPDGRHDELRVRVPSYGAPTELSASATKDGRKVLVPVAERMQQIRYEVVDADGLSATGLILIPGRNDSIPVLRDPAVNLEATAGQMRVIDINSQVAGTAGRSVRLAGVDFVSKTHGQVALRSERIEFTPDVDYEGPASVVFKVSDVSSEGDKSVKSAFISIPLTVLPAPNQPGSTKEKELQQARRSPELIGKPILRVGPGEGKVRLDLLPLFRDPDGDTFFFENFSHSSGDKAVDYQISDDHTKVLASTDITTRPTTVRILNAEVVDANDGRTKFQIRLEVVPSTRPLTTTVTDPIDALAGKEVSVAPLSNDKSNLLDRPQLTLTDAKIISGSGAIRYEGDIVKITPSEGFVGTLTARYTVMDATEDPNRRVDGTIRVTVKDRPSRPGVPRDGVVGNGTVTFTYSPSSSNGFDVTERIATAITANGGVAKTTPCKSTTCTVTGLKNDVPYQFTVLEKNFAGDSDPSLPSATYTPDVKPNAPGKPSIQFGDKQLTATWQPPTWLDPTNPGSPVDRYTLVLLDEGGTQVGSLDLTGGATTHTWTGLNNGSRYRFKVLAGNKAGPSPFSEISDVDWPAGPPLASPSIAATATANPLGGAFEVRWTAAGIDANGDPVKEFVVTPVSEQGIQTALGRTVAVTGQAEQNVLIDGLGQKPYKFRVEAINKSPVRGVAAATPQWQTAWELPKVEMFTVTAGDATIQMGVMTNFQGRAAANPQVQFRLNGGEWRPYPSTGKVGGLVNGQVYDVAARVVIDGDRASEPRAAAAVMPRSAGPKWPSLNPSSLAFQGFSGGAAQVFVQLDQATTLVDSGGWEPIKYWFVCGGEVTCSPAGRTRSNNFVVSSNALNDGPVNVEISLGHEEYATTSSSAFTVTAPFTGSWNSTSGALNFQISHVRSASCRATGGGIDKTWNQGGGSSLSVGEVLALVDVPLLPSRVDVTCTFGRNQTATLVLNG